MHLEKRWVVACLSAAVSIVSQAQVAQEPLLNRPNSVQPNLLLLVDDSQSMQRGYIYEYGDNGRAADLQNGPTGPNPNPATPNDALHSPDINRLAYDPRVRYLPRPDYLGNPIPISTSGSNPFPANPKWSVLFRIGAGPYARVTNGPLEDRSHGGYYTPSYTPPASEVVPGSAAVYPNDVDVAATPARLFPKFLRRTDCKSLAGACTMAEEVANRASWWYWYPTRSDMAQTGLGLAMLDVPADSVRLGYGLLSLLGRGPASGAPVLSRGVASYSDGVSGTKKQFYDWLYALTFPGSTPTLNAFNSVGRYFERSDSDGPWATLPDPASVGITTVASPNGPGSAEATGHHASCRRSFSMLITDGYWNDGAAGTRPPPVVGNRDNAVFSIPRDVGPPFDYTPVGPYKDNASNTLADLAMHYWGRDLRPDLPNRVPPLTTGATQNPSTWQNVSFYAVTLGMRGTLPKTAATLADLTSGAVQWPTPSADKQSTIDDTWHATLNGRGELTNANNASELTDAIKRMMQGIAGAPQTLSGVAVSSTYLRNGSRKYKPEYAPGIWAGNLSAIELDGNTGNDKVPPVIFWQVEAGVDVNNDPISTIPIAAARNIATWSGTTGVTFNAANTGLAADVTDYVRGDPSKELRKPGGSYRSRVARLGDIVNSSPAFIKDNVDLAYENLGFGDYRAFIAAKAARSQGVLFVGANDGMLHAFRDSDGVETFAFVPKAVIPNLPTLTATPFVHRYFVDGPNVETDAYLGGAWKNLLLGTTGAGAKAVYALDVTDPLNMTPSKVMWEISAATPGFSNMGHVLSDVQAGVLPSGDWVAVFGNGVKGTGGAAILFVVNLQTGALMREIDTGVTGGNGLGGVRLVLNDSRQVIGAYAGDLKGNMWKFDLTTSTSTPALGGSPLYAAGTRQPITAAPAVLPHPLGGNVVSFGTGKFFDLADATGPYDTQRLYGVWDAQPFGASSTPAGAAMPSISQLVQQTITVVPAGSPAVDFYRVSANDVAWGNGLTGPRGWYIDLPNTGQRMVYPMERLPGTFILASTLSPESRATQDICVASGSGSGWVYIIDGVTGSGPTKRALDTNGDGVIDDVDQVVSGYVDPVDGRPTSIGLPSSKLADQLCIETAQSSCTRVLLQCGQAGANACPGATASGIKTREWRQIFMR